MNIPPYWAKERYQATGQRGSAPSFVACGWSFSSLEDARRDALGRAKRMFESITGGKTLGRYEYHDRPIKEEILREVGDREHPIAFITRNRYGALVLNTRSVLFADVDFPISAPGSFFESILLMFSPSRRRAGRQAIIDETIQRVKRWGLSDSSRGFRLYRTREGLRVLFTDKLYDPASEQTAAILKDLQSDPMYIKLTHKQECFRARLTSKPWRCGCNRPPSAFPWENAKAEQEFRRWESDYSRKDASHKACELLEQIGPVSDNPELTAIVSVHDRGSRIQSGAPLA